MTISPQAARIVLALCWLLAAAALGCVLFGVFLLATS